MKNVFTFILLACAAIFLAACGKENPETNLEAFERARQSGNVAFPCSQAIQLEILKSSVRSELVDIILTGWGPAATTPEVAFLKAFGGDFSGNTILKFSQDIDNDGVPEIFFSFPQSKLFVSDSMRSRGWVMVKKLDINKWRVKWGPQENFYVMFLNFPKNASTFFVKTEKIPNGAFVSHVSATENLPAQCSPENAIWINYYAPEGFIREVCSLKKLPNHLGISWEKVVQLGEKILVEEATMARAESDVPVKRDLQPLPEIPQNQKSQELLAFEALRKSGAWKSFPSENVQQELLKSRIRRDRLETILYGLGPANKTPLEAFLTAWNYESKNEWIYTFSQDVDNDGVPEHFFSYSQTHSNPEDNYHSRTWKIVKKIGDEWRALWLPAENFDERVLAFSNHRHLTFFKNKAFPNGAFVLYVTLKDLDFPDIERYPAEIVYFTPERCWYYRVPAEELPEFLGISLDEIPQKYNDISIKTIPIPD